MDDPEEEFSEWVVIQDLPTSSPIDASSPPNSPILQPSHHLENPPENDDFIVPTVGEEEGESSSTAMPWRVIETAEKRLIKVSGFFFKAVEKVRYNYVTRRRVFWSFSLIGGFVLLSSLVMRWWRRLQEEKLRFLLLLLREKDQKIKELMLQIGRLNELLSSRRRVQVVRIV